MPIAASVASHKRSRLRSPFAAKAMMRFCDGLSDDFRLSAVVEGGDGLVKNRAQHRDRFGVTINVGRNKSTNLTHDAAPLARSARRSFFCRTGRDRSCNRQRTGNLNLGRATV